MFYHKRSTSPTQTSKREKKKRNRPQLASFIAARDYQGALALIEFNRSVGEGSNADLPWAVYSAFHGGDYKSAIRYIRELKQITGDEKTLDTYLGCCLYFLGKYEDAEKAALSGPNSRLRTRLLFHIAHKQNDETKLLLYHQRLVDEIEDQMSLAAIHGYRGHYQEAIDVYKRMLLEKRDFIALQVYVAICYYKLDYHDISQEVLQPYLQEHPDSVFALNLKACNTCRLYSGKVAEEELRPILENGNLDTMFAGDLIRHNLVVFREGKDALRVFPPLVRSIPEARLNLVIFHLKRGEYKEAYDLIKDVEPGSPQEYILKGTVYAALGQELDNQQYLKSAQQHLSLVGQSPSECDTLPGRQCMASALFLQEQWNDVVMYLKSIEEYFYNSNEFLWNFGIALAASGDFVQGEAKLLQIRDNDEQGRAFRSEYVYMSWLAKCYIRNGKPELAWALYDRNIDSGADAFHFLQLVANECYRVGAFFYAAKAFDILERLDPHPDYWEGKRGACMGVFQQVVAGKESAASLKDAIKWLRSSQSQSPQVELFVRTMRRWAKENGVRL